MQTILSGEGSVYSSYRVLLPCYSCKYENVASRVEELATKIPY